MPDFQYDRRRFVEPITLAGVERSARRNAYDIDTKVVATVSTATPGSGLTIPGGVVISPPTLSAPDGYPISRVIPGDDITADHWALIDGLDLGWFSRSLLFSQGSVLNVLNMDNTNQRVTYQGTSLVVGNITTRRNGMLWSGSGIWNGTAFVTQQTVVVTTPGGAVGTMTGAALGRGLTDGSFVQDASFTYFVETVTLEGTAAPRVCRIAHGSSVVEAVSSDLRAGVTSRVLYRLLGVENGTAWVTGGVASGSITYATLTTANLQTGQVTVFGTPQSPPSVLFGFGNTTTTTTDGNTHQIRSSFVLTDGSLAFLVTNGSDPMCGLRILDQAGTFVTLWDFYPRNRIPSSVSASAFLAIPGSNTKVITTIGAGVLDSLSPQGWQEVVLPAELGDVVKNASIRWADSEWGRTLQWAATANLYEGTLAL